MGIVLNEAEREQYSRLVKGILEDNSNQPKPARCFEPLVRGRVCVFLNQTIDQQKISIEVDRTGEVNLYKKIMN